MPLITVNQGNASNIEDGVYPVVLTDIKGPKTVTAQRGPKAGQDVDLLDWIFEVEGDSFTGEVVEASTSTASGPRSKMYAYLTALHNGKAPVIGASFEKEQLVGLRALATIRKDDQGWPRIENLGAIPAAMLGKAVAQATGAPTNDPVAAAPTSPLREAVGAGAGASGDDLPF